MLDTPNPEIINQGRIVVCDTETTGFSPEAGHRIIEIGAVEMVDGSLTGKEFHCYIDPRRPVDPGAFKVHGLSEEFLKDKPVFGAIAEEFLSFFGDSLIAAHNAKFDISFFNAELARLNLPPIESSRVIDTLQMARRALPGSPASLDALCRRFNIDNSHRDKHGALLDAQLLGHIMIELAGGRQRTLQLDTSGTEESVAGAPVSSRPTRTPRPHAVSEAELAAHCAFIEKKVPNSLWNA